MKEYNDHLIIEPKDCNCRTRGSVIFECVVCDKGLDICINCGKAESELDGPCIKKSIDVIKN